MFSSANFLALVGLIPFVLAAPAAELSTRAATIDTSSHCGTSTSLALTRKSNTHTHISGQWDSVAAGQYSLILDQWGLSGASSGSDCAQLTSLSGTTVAWKTTWTWTGGSGVKSFTNMQLDSGLNKQLSAIKSIPVCPFLSVLLHDQLLTRVYFIQRLPGIGLNHPRVLLLLTSPMIYSPLRPPAEAMLTKS
jgi:xyloglucan-specific endo-beta-1,4-glucanase